MIFGQNEQNRWSVHNQRGRVAEAGVSLERGCRWSVSAIITFHSIYAISDTLPLEEYICHLHFIKTQVSLTLIAIRRGWRLRFLAQVRHFETREGLAQNLSSSPLETFFTIPSILLLSSSKMAARLRDIPIRLPPKYACSAGYITFSLDKKETGTQ